jgi:DNA-binding NarL/FixJ family response regulator
LACRTEPPLWNSSANVQTLERGRCLRRTFADGDAGKVSAQQPLRVLIADDHPVIRRSFRQDLEAAGVEVCAEAATGSEAVHAALRERPDVCLLDVRMPEGGGITATESIRRSLPGVRIVLITAFPDEDGVLAAARAGADGYLAKDVDRRRLQYVLRAVAEGETAYPGRLLRALLRTLQSPECSGN